MNCRCKELHLRGRCDRVAEATCAKWGNKCFVKIGAHPIFDKSYQFIHNFSKTLYLKNTYEKVLFQEGCWPRFQPTTLLKMNSVIDIFAAYKISRTVLTGCIGYYCWSNNLIHTLEGVLFVS